MNGLNLFALTMLFSFALQHLKAQTVLYTMPEETEEHEGTWLQWPHHYQYGMLYRNDIDQTWVDMTAGLVQSENVHIIAYDATEQSRIEQLLSNAGVSMAKVDFFLFPTDDCWIRDNGPIFVYDNNNQLHLTDWGFNGWGNDADYALCDAIPASVSQAVGLPRVDLNAMVLEGGAIEIDGHGTMVATRSCIVHQDRNPSLTEAQIEDYLTENLGITNFIWLNGINGLEITDMHIDGFARFLDKNTMITMTNADLLAWDVPQNDINTLFSAQNAEGANYSRTYLPLTVNNVVTTYNQNLGYKGSYINYYVGNTVVLVPNYNDPNDSVANGIIQSLYPNRTVIGIDVRNLYANGGMIHCVTQQQPVANPTSISKTEQPQKASLAQNNPNPFSKSTTIQFRLEQAAKVELDLFNSAGGLIKSLTNGQFDEGLHEVLLDSANLPSGSYTYSLKINGYLISSKKMTLVN